MKTQTFLIWSILTVASLFDARWYKIPNQLIVLGYTAGLFLNIQMNGPIGIIYFIVKALAPVIILYLLYKVKGLGAGDIKLFSVMSTLVGMRLTGRTMVISVFLAGLAIVILSIYEGQIIKRKLHYSFYMTAAFLLLQYI